MVLQWISQTRGCAGWRSELLHAAQEEYISANTAVINADMVYIAHNPSVTDVSWGLKSGSLGTPEKLSIPDDIRMQCQLL